MKTNALISVGVIALLALAGIVVTSERTIVVKSVRAVTRSSATETRAVVTAYSEIDSCHYAGCPMANGKRAEVGYVACPRSVALGTIVELQGIVYECGDRTAKRYDGRYDVFMGYGVEAHTKALEWGVKSLTIQVINRGGLNK